MVGGSGGGGGGGDSNSTKFVKVVCDGCNVMRGLWLKAIHSGNTCLCFVFSREITLSKL